MRPSMYACSFFLALLSAGIGQAQIAFTALFHPGTAPVRHAFEQNWEELLDREQENKRDSFCLIDLETEIVNEQRLFWGLWEKNGQASRIEWREDWTAFLQLKWQLEDSLYLDHINAHTLEDGRTRFIGVWKPGRRGHSVWRIDELDQLPEIEREMADRYRFLRDVEPVHGDSSGSLLALFHEGTPTSGGELVQVEDLKQLQRENQLREKSGYHLSDLEGWSGKSGKCLLALYQKGNGKVRGVHGVDAESLHSHRQYFLESHALRDLEIVAGKGRRLAPPEHLHLRDLMPNLQLPKTRGVEPFNREDLTLLYALADGLYAWERRSGLTLPIPPADSTKGVQARDIARFLVDSIDKQGAAETAPIYQLVDELVRLSDTLSVALRFAFYGLHTFREDHLRRRDSLMRLHVEDETVHLSRELARNALHHEQIVLFQFGYYLRDSATERGLRREGGEWGILTGYGRERGTWSSPEDFYLNFPGGTGEAGQLRTRLEPLSRFFSNYRKLRLCATADCRRPQPVEGSWRAYPWPERKDGAIPVWESMCILELRR